MMPDGYPVQMDLNLGRLLTDEERCLSLVVCDAWLPDNPIVFVSPQFSRYTGYQATEAVGRNCRFLQGPETDPAAVRELRLALREERSVTVEILNYRKDGTPFWNALSVRPAYASNGRLTSFLGVQRALSCPADAYALRPPAPEGGGGIAVLRPDLQHGPFP